MAWTNCGCGDIGAILWSDFNIVQHFVQFLPVCAKDVFSIVKHSVSIPCRPLACDTGINKQRLCLVKAVLEVGDLEVPDVLLHVTFNSFTDKHTLSLSLWGDSVWLTGR